MRTQTAVALAAASSTLVSAMKQTPHHHSRSANTDDLPSLEVPACPSVGTLKYDKSVPDLAPFPLTQVDLCYSETSPASGALLHLDFTAYNETNFFYNPDYGMNDAIYEYEVLEAFISRGKETPQTYLEWEVAPNNVTWHGAIYNPTKVRAENATFSHLMITDPYSMGMTVETVLDRENEIWTSKAQIPLGLFNVDEGEAKGTEWRMNFFRIVVDPETFPEQFLGGWSPPDQASFHMSPFFGHVKFV